MIVQKLTIATTLPGSGTGNDSKISNFSTTIVSGLKPEKEKIFQCDVGKAMTLPNGAIVSYDPNNGNVFGSRKYGRSPILSYDPNNSNFSRKHGRSSPDSALRVRSNYEIVSRHYLQRWREKKSDDDDTMNRSQSETDAVTDDDNIIFGQPQAKRRRVYHPPRTTLWLDAPFSRSDRNRARKSAIYYGECSLRGILPVVADTAASEMLALYQKWWVKAVYRHHSADRLGGEPLHWRDVQQQHQEKIFPRPQSTSSQIVVTTTWATPLPTKIARKNTSQHIATEEKCYSDCSGNTSIEMSDSEESSLAVANYNKTIPAGDAINDCPITTKKKITRMKGKIIASLRATGGDTSNPLFLSHLERLQNFHGHLLQLCGDGKSLGLGGGASMDAAHPRTVFLSTPVRSSPEGNWLDLTKKAVQGCLGRNEAGDPLYTLGRMSFDMFRPSSLICSMRHTTNRIRLIDPSYHDTLVQSADPLPRRILKQLRRDRKRQKREQIKRYHDKKADSLRNGEPKAILRHFDVVVSFTIEPNHNSVSRDDTSSSTIQKEDINATGNTCPGVIVSRPINGLLINRGYMSSDPDVPTRSSIWFSGGSLQVEHPEDLEEWRRIFGYSNHDNDESGNTSVGNSQEGNDCLSQRTSTASENTGEDFKGSKSILKALSLDGKGDGMDVDDGKKSSKPHPSQQGQQSSPRNESAKRSSTAEANALAAKLLLGASIPEEMQEDGTMTYNLERPIGGHGEVFCDEVYLDNDFRIIRGHHGTIYVHTRVVEGSTESRYGA